jgi:hypothetical protein
MTLKKVPTGVCMMITCSGSIVCPSRFRHVCVSSTTGNLSWHQYMAARTWLGVGRHTTPSRCDLWDSCL